MTTTDRDAVERLAPERVYGFLDVDHGGRFWEFSTHGTEADAEYVLKSHADAQLQAAVAEFREAAAEKCERAAKSEVGRERAYLLSHAAWFRSSFPAPTDALERAIEAEREACAAAVGNLRSGRGAHYANADVFAAAIRARSDAQTWV